MTDRKRYIIHITITILIMVFIFLQSSFTGDQSSEESDWVISLFSGEEVTADELATLLVRKSAHVIEYLCLGLSLTFAVRDVAVLRKAGKDKFLDEDTNGSEDSI